MQRNEQGLVVISCDFCASDWDEVKPMMEGHHGSVVCLECLKRALTEAQAAPTSGPFTCTMCLQERPAEMVRWSHPDRAQAVICRECIHLAARTYDRDDDVEWTWDRKKLP